MAKQDIMPFNSAHGGTYRVTRAYMAASETFFEGEPVRLEAAGTVTQCGDDPTAANLYGIAAAGPGSDSDVTNPRTGTTIWSEGENIPVWVPEPGMQFVTENWSAAGSAFDDTPPTIANIGDEVGLSLIGGIWGIDISTTNNVGRLIDILDDNKHTIVRANGTDVALAVGDTYYCVFEIVAHQGVPDGSPAAPGA